MHVTAEASGFWVYCPWKGVSIQLLRALSWKHNQLLFSDLEIRPHLFYSNTRGFTYWDRKFTGQETVNFHCLCITKLAQLKTVGLPSILKIMNSYYILNAFCVVWLRGTWSLLCHRAVFGSSFLWLDCIWHDFTNFIVQVWWAPS